MIKKIGKDIIKRKFSEASTQLTYSGRIVGPQKLLGGWKWDIYKHSQKPIPYVRFFQGRRKMAEFPLTQVARTAMGTFLITVGIPSENISQVLNGIYNILSGVVTHRITSPPKKHQRIPKEVRVI